MKIEIDTHTHTVLSGHAHSTLLENAQYAAKAGLKGMVMSEHGPSLEGAPPVFNISTYKVFPELIEGVRVYRGIEANIIDYDGKLDVPERFLSRLDFVIAAMHNVTIHAGDTKQNTQAVLGALDNPYVDAIAHPGNRDFSLDQRAVIETAREKGKLIEVNNRSFVFREGSSSTCTKIIQLCRDLKARVIVSSDAHFCYEVGAFDYAIDALAKNGFPEELIVNRTRESFEAYLAERAARIKK